MKKNKVPNYPSFMKRYMMLADIFFTEPISIPVSLILAKMKVHPNVITFIALLSGITSGLMFVLGHWITGALLFYFAYLCDGIDGQVARRSNKYSEFGARLDVFADGFKKPSCFLGIAIYFIIQKSYIGVFLTCAAFALHIGTHKLYKLLKVTEYDLEFPDFHRKIIRNFVPRALCLYTFTEEQLLEFFVFPLIGGIIGLPKGGIWFFYGAVFVLILALIKLVILLNHRRKGRYDNVYQDWGGTKGNLEKSYK
jgi:phosphatidylglycerophosphate synthase